jgi:hypothetical protein
MVGLGDKGYKMSVLRCKDKGSLNGVKLDETLPEGSGS